MQHPEVKSLSSEAKNLIVMLHGVGSDGHDLIGLVPFLQKSLPSCHFFSPHGVEPYDMSNYGRQWFSLQDRTPSTIFKIAAQNAPLVMKLIKNKQRELGLTNAETILLGFSQGTMMSIYITLSQEDPFAAMIGFSGRNLPPPEVKNHNTPICIIHGKEDSVINSNESIALSEFLTKNNITNEVLIVPNLMHSIDASGIKFAIKFLNNIL